MMEEQTSLEKKHVQIFLLYLTLLQTSVQLPLGGLMYLAI